MAFDFPNSPTEGQSFTPSGGPTYVYNSGRWLSSAYVSASVPSHTHPQGDITSLVADLALKAPLASPALTGVPTVPTASPGTSTQQVASTAFVAAIPNVTISDTAPSSPIHGRLWWESDTGKLLLYYNDGSSSQWIDIGDMGGGSVGPIGPAGPVGPTGPGGLLAAATTDETLTGTNTTKAATPDSVAALWERGTDVAPTSTLILGEGGYFQVSGTPTTITRVNFEAPHNGRTAWLRFMSGTAGTILVHDSVYLPLPGAANITVGTGDRACFVQTGGSGNSACLSYVCTAAVPMAEEIGTYTPTLYATLNITGTLAYDCQYMRLGNMVLVSGKFEATPTAATVTEMELSLPIASELTSHQNLGGTAASTISAARIYAATVNNRAAVRWTAPSTVNSPFGFSFMYQVL